MKIAVVAANGKAGRLIVTEAMARGMEVTAVVRGENKTEAKSAIKKDVFSLTADDLAGFDAVVDALGAWTADSVHTIYDAVKHLADILKGTETRLAGIVGSIFLLLGREGLVHAIRI